MKILILGAGGSASTNFVRSLRLSFSKYHIIGTDCNKYYLQRAETDEKFLIPPATDENYIDKLNDIIKKTGAEFIHAQNDAEVLAISENRDKLACKYFLPTRQNVVICQDKYLSYLNWEKEFEKPLTFLIRSEEDLVEAFKHLKGKMWIRDIRGAGGKGSLLTDDYSVAENWIKFKKGWETYTIAEYLSPDSTTFTTIWNNGELVVGQGRKRLYWELNGLSMTGVTGATGTGVTENNPEAVRVAMKAILAINDSPHGIWSVDMTYGQDGKLYPTEINIGRFFTTHLFFSQLGLNLPDIFIKTAFGEEYKGKKINPLVNGWAWIRGMDFEPVLTHLENIENPTNLPHNNP